MTFYVVWVSFAAVMLGGTSLMSTWRTGRRRWLWRFRQLGDTPWSSVRRVSGAHPARTRDGQVVAETPRGRTYAPNSSAPTTHGGACLEYEAMRRSCLRPHRRRCRLCRRRPLRIGSKREPIEVIMAPRSGAGLRSAMAPGGVEPPRTDSKSVALSAELRGRAGRVTAAAAASRVRYQIEEALPRSSLPPGRHSVER